ncbi:MAG: HMA2 domain-containing protein [Gammaproteobacteria bacterium]
MSQRFYIAHHTQGRTRIRWASAANRKSDVLDIAQTLGELDGVEYAEARPATGSIIIEHPETEWSQLQASMEQQCDLYFSTAVESPVGNGIQSLKEQLDKLNSLLREQSNNQTDLKNLTVNMLLILAIIQAARGQVMGSAASFLWYALNITTRSTGSTVDTDDMSSAD